ncbi:MAG TPA: tetratricopeptide repeat protein [Bryobacteraceae bacterium]|jgi:tetratricopeptide (TPR) repeat protein|nr:tetratricopeptide repeat protein [Bryobacteraceae bacterium]
MYRSKQQRVLARTLFVLLFSALSANAGAQNEDAAIATHFRAGQEAASNQQFDRAIAEFTTVLKLDPTLVQARANLGLMYYSKHEYNEAVTEFRKVVRAAPDLLPGELFLGLSYVNVGKPDEAIPALRRALQLDPNNEEARRALLLSYLERDQYDQATEQLSILQKQPAAEEPLYTIAQGYLELGRRLTSGMAKQYRSSAWAHRLAGDLAGDRGDWLAAADSYRHALIIDPEISGVHAALAKALRAAGKENEAVAEDAVPKQPASVPVNCDADQLLSCERRLRAKPTAEIFYRLIRANTALGNTYFAKLQSSFPDSARAHELRAEIYRLRQDFPSALTEFQLALVKLPEDSELHQNVGEMLLLLGRVDDAETELRRAIALSPTNAETEYLLAQVSLKRDNLEAAISHLKTALQHDPNLIEVHALLGTAYMHVDKPALAIPELNYARAIDYHGDLAFQLFKAYRALGNSAAADEALRRSKELRKKSNDFAVSQISGEDALADQQVASH